VDVQASALTHPDHDPLMVAVVEELVPADNVPLTEPDFPPAEVVMVPDLVIQLELP
jgi:hypothetical protein